MLTPVDIILKLTRYMNEEFSSSFLKETIQYFKTLRDPIDIISENKYELELTINVLNDIKKERNE